MDSKKAWVAGMGCVCACGNTVDEAFQGALKELSSNDNENK